jgi:hypothetical protein
MNYFPIHQAGFLPSLILTAAWFLLLLRARASIWRLALLALPGTFAHELAHFVVGLLLLAKPAGFSLRPKRSDHGWTLGSVSFRGINVFNGAFVALAPISFLPLAWFGLIRLVGPFWVHHQWGWWLAGGYLISTIFFAAIPSFQDIKQGGPSLFLYGTLGGLGWFVSSKF